MDGARQEQWMAYAYGIFHINHSEWSELSTVDGLGEVIF